MSYLEIWEIGYLGSYCLPRYALFKTLTDVTVANTFFLTRSYFIYKNKFIHSQSQTISGKFNRYLVLMLAVSLQPQAETRLEPLEIL